MLLTFTKMDAQEKSNKIYVTNKLDFPRKEVLSIPYASFVKKIGADTVFRLVQEGTNRELPIQFERLGSQDIQNLLVYVEVPARSRLVLRVEKNKRSNATRMTYARYVPERKDDFAWENDKVAFRMYGKALEDFPAENAHGTDVWAKRTSRLVVDEWYRSGDYHADHGDGLDYYSVGLTLGAGDVAPYVADSVRYPKHYRDHEVLDNGPLRSTFRLIYEPWAIDGQQVSVVKTISIDAGSQLNRVEATFSFDGRTTLPVVAGIALRGDKGDPYEQVKEGIAAYWEPPHGKDGTLGIGVVAGGKVKAIFMAHGQLLTLMSASSGKPLVYYNGAAWDKAGEITSSKDWQAYLERFSKVRRYPLGVKIK